MHVASVTLDEVLRAAHGRAAALVPETAGYLALAIGDASARLPYRVEDELVTLTTEGTVRVSRGRESVSPEEGARVLRDHLRRLLSVSAGTMPGLAQAGTPRKETSGPESVIAEIEAALIPVNRAAARRSLARLARDTAKARDLGRMAAKAPPPSRSPSGPSSAPSADRAERIARSPVAVAAPPPAVLHEQEAPRQEPSPAKAPVAPTYEAQPLAAYEPTYEVRAAATYEPTYEARPVATYEPTYDYDVEVLFEAEVEPSTPAQVFHPTVRDPVWPVLEDPTCRIAVPISSPVARPGWVDTLAAASAAASEHVASAGELPDLHDPTYLDPDVLRVVEAAEAAAADTTPRLGTPAPRVLFSQAALPAPEAPQAAPVPGPPPIQFAPGVDAAAMALDAHLRSGRLAAAAPVSRPILPRTRRPPWQAELRRATRSDADSLLASFQPSNPTEDATKMRRDLKKLVGVDATQLPPRVRTGSS